MTTILDQSPAKMKLDTDRYKLVHQRSEHYLVLGNILCIHLIDLHERRYIFIKTYDASSCEVESIFNESLLEALDREADSMANRPGNQLDTQIHRIRNGYCLTDSEYLYFLNSIAESIRRQSQSKLFIIDSMILGPSAET